jgi:serine/threonine-protein kinase HipA
MAKREPLAVWLHGVRIATLTTNGKPYHLAMRYSAEALETWPGNTPLLSCSLPLSTQKLDPREYFRGLLPEGPHLARVAARAKISVTDLHGLLARYGRDVAGAVTVLPEGDDPSGRPGGAVAYDDASLAGDVEGLETMPLAIHDDSELSLPGLQNKLLLIRDADTWFRPTGGRPSTHILKVEDRRFPGLVAAEAAAMRLARRVGLTTVDVDVVTVAGIDCIIVERYDRTIGADREVSRIHQEDVCQALGHDAEANNGGAKYERGGGPGLSNVADLLERYAVDPVAELRRLVRYVTFNTVIGNVDAHAKNVSLIHRRAGTVELAPLYGTVPTVLFPTLNDRAAMFVNTQTVLSKVTIDDVVAEAAGWMLDSDVARAEATATVDAMTGELDAIPQELASVIRMRAAHFR